ncbi:MAG: hypothetical protein IJ417_07635 [Bacteroidaceae bacterium]|nr:hypothetical protein [Lachnospiraceae bacterium]MBQ8608041.1 hypothetical protein [Bacteroidaceae bacterium]
MIQFEVGKMYDCGSYNGNDNVFRIASRTETTVDLIAIYEIEDEELESSVGTWNIEVIDDVECVLIEQGYFDDDDKEYIMADYPY